MSCASGASRDVAYSEWNVNASRCGVPLELRTVRTRTTKLTVGLYDQVYDSVQPFNPNPIPDSYSTDATKYAVYWDNTLHWTDQHTTVLGAVYENSEFWYFSYWNNTWGIPPVTTDARGFATAERSRTAAVGRMSRAPRL